MVIHPLKPRHATLRAYDDFESFDFQAGITYEIVVG